MKSNQIDVFAPAVLRDLKKIQDAEEPGGQRQRRGDIGKTDRLDGIDFDRTLVVDTVAAAHFDVGAQPDPYAAGDFPAANSFAQSFREDHRESLRFS